MAMLTIGSVCGSPGATTLAMGLAAVWPQPDVTRVTVEADPDGGRLGAELGVGVEPGVVSLSVAARNSDTAPAALIAEHAADMHGWWLLPAPPSGEQATNALVRSAPTLARLMSSCDVLAVVDAGRLSTRSPALPLAISSAVVVLVAAGDFPSLQLLPSRIAALAAAGCPVRVAVSGASPWPAPDIAEFVGADVVSMLPGVRVRSGARSMSGGEWSGWWTAVRELAALLRSSVDATAHGARPQEVHQ